MSKITKVVPTFTQENLKELVSYNQGTGEFIWLNNTNSSVRGKVAGWIRPDGYAMINVFGQDFRQHRLAYFYMMGKMPENQIDHINHNKSDNRWENLREASASENAIYSGKKSTNTSGFKGVSYDKARKLWRVSGKLNKKYIFLGRYPTINEAVVAYDTWSKTNHKEFYFENTAN